MLAKNFRKWKAALKYSVFLIFSLVLRPPNDLDFKANSYWQLNRKQNEDTLSLLWLLDLDFSIRGMNLRQEGI